MSKIEHCVKKVDNSLCALIPIAILLQGEANAILAQQGLFYRRGEVKSDYINHINANLDKTKSAAETLLNECMDNVSQSVVSFQHYFTIHRSVFANINKETSRLQWINNLQLLRSTADIFQKDIVRLESRISDLIEQLAKIKVSFASAVRAFNLAANGDNGILTRLNNNLNQLNTNIYGTLAGILSANLLIIGGTLVILIGSVSSEKNFSAVIEDEINIENSTAQALSEPEPSSDFYHSGSDYSVHSGESTDSDSSSIASSDRETIYSSGPHANDEININSQQQIEVELKETVAYYTNWKLMALGVFTGGVGLGGNIGGLIYLSKLFKKKDNAIFMKTAIEIEVKLALSINNSCENLDRIMRQFESNIRQIKKDWIIFSDLIKKIEDDLGNQKSSTREVNLLFKFANYSVETAMNNVTLIKNKLSGVTIINDKKGQGVRQLILKNIHSTLTS